MKGLFIFLLFGSFYIQTATGTAPSKQIKENNIKDTAETPVKKPGLKTGKENKSSLSLHKKAKKDIPQSVVSIPCTDYFKTKYERGHIERQLVPCSVEDYNSGICLSQLEVLRNYCKDNQLIRYYCDSRKQEGYSSESIPCEKGCVLNSGKCSR